jgi:hypothetical protein
MNYATELASPNVRTIVYSESRVHKCDSNLKIRRTDTTVLCPTTDLKATVKRITKINALLLPKCTVATLLKPCASTTVVWGRYVNPRLPCLCLITWLNSKFLSSALFPDQFWAIIYISIWMSYVTATRAKGRYLCLCCVVSCRDVLRRVLCAVSCCILLRRVVSCCVASYRVVLCLVLSCRVVSWCVVSVSRCVVFNNQPTNKETKKLTSLLTPRSTESFTSPQFLSESSHSPKVCTNRSNTLSLVPTLSHNSPIPLILSS